MNSKFKDLSLLTVITIGLTFLVWLPHFLALPNFWGLNFSQGFATIYRNFDGFEYVVIAKTWYNLNLLAQIPQNLSANYFAAHFPGYSVLIALFTPFLGALKSMIFTSLLSTILATCSFYLLVRDFKLTSHPVFLSVIFLILPARWLIVHSVGSSEPLFIFFVILTIYFFMKFNEAGKFSYIVFAALFGAAAQFTRPPGVLLGAALALYVLWQTYQKRSISYLFSYFPLILIPATLLGIFYWYQLTYQDFFAYFHSGDNIHLSFPPFQVFNKEAFWVGDIWLEDIVYTFILGLLAALLLIKRKLYALGFFVLTYISASFFIAHRDISRYVLPITPFVLIAFEKVLTSREFKIILPIILLAIYLYSQNFILSNVAPIPDLEIYN